MAEGMRELSEDFVIRALTPFMRAPPPWPNHKGPTFKHCNSGDYVSTCEFLWGHMYSVYSRYMLLSKLIKVHTLIIRGFLSVKKHFCKQKKNLPPFVWSWAQTDFWSLSSIARVLSKVFLACSTLSGATFALTEGKKMMRKEWGENKHCFFLFVRAENLTGRWRGSWHSRMDTKRKGYTEETMIYACRRTKGSGKWTTCP